MTKIIANPIDLPYRLQDLSIGPYRTVAREAADPSVVAFGGRYWLFASVSGGLWHSADLADWDFLPTPDLPVFDYAPDLQVIDGWLVTCASKSRGICSFFRTKDPQSGVWEEIPGTFSFFDPCLFQDDDGRVYLYWGSSGRTPVQGQELDRQTFRPKGVPVPIVVGQPKMHGWERMGADWDDGNRLAIQTAIQGNTYMEGAWMTKHAGVYYLQYSSTGTQLNTYSDGYYTAAAPLGPFSYSAASPFSSNPTGFMPAAGHGSTFQDRHGNWWHVATMRISKKYVFERRIGLWPAGFDDDGVLFCNQEFSDHPLVVPDGPANPWSLTATAMLLSRGRPVRASSVARKHPAELAVTEDARTWWAPASRAPGEWISVELAAGLIVSHIQVNLAEHDVHPPKRTRADTGRTLIWRRHIDLSEPPVEVHLEGSVDGEHWETIADTRGSQQSRTHVFVTLPEPRPFRHVRVTGHAQPYGSTFAVSGLRVFGHGDGATPETLVPRTRRLTGMDAEISWKAVPGATGYNLRYGLAPDKLYHSWRAADRTRVLLGSLNAGHEYWVAVDPFNENGVTRGKPVRVPVS